MDIDPDLDLDPDDPPRLNREEAKTGLILAVGIWLVAVEVLNVGPLVASGVVGAFAVFAAVVLLETEF